MNKLDQLNKFWAIGGCSVQIVDAPKDAQTFDKMIVVIVDERSDLQKLAGVRVDNMPSKKIIRRVSLYNSKEDKIVSEY